MQTEHFTVINVKCGGCVTNIKTGLAELDGVNSVEVNIDSGKVVVKGTELDRTQLSAKLAGLGYPQA